MVEIARTFRRTPQLAGIAKARSAQLQGRITAIVDASCARRLRPFTALTLLVLLGALALSVGGSSPACSRRPTADSVLRQEQISRLQSFAQAKEKQSQPLAAAAGEQITPEFQTFFNAAIKGDWQTVTNRFAYLKQHHPQYIKGTNTLDTEFRTACWQPVLEILLAYNQVIHCEPKYTAILADGIINSIPAGSIYFGGTDAGRGVPTAFCKSSIEGEPFFSLTQNALTDSGYLNYLRAMYGGKIYTPTAEDSQRCYQEYLADAQRRLQEHKLRPGEEVRMVDGKVQVSGHIAVIGIRGPLSKIIFDRNPDREFYVEESFPLDWMYPHLEPHGLIMKINRQPLAQLPEEVMARDHEYWRKVVGGMVGDWLDDQTAVRRIVEFVDRVYVRKDLKGFTGDPNFVRNACAKQEFSKLRASIAGVYAWRLGTNAPQEYRPRTEADRQALVNETDFAFRQAFVLCPYSPEAIFRYISFLLQFKRLDDATLVAEAGLKADPKNGQVRGLLDSLKSYKRQREHGGEATNHLGLGVAPDKKGQIIDEAIRQFKEARRPKPGYEDARGLIAGYPNTQNNLGSSLKKEVGTRRFTAAEAGALAEQLANEKAWVLYKCQPFHDGPPAEFVEGHWVWDELRGRGSLDVEATVKFAADGTNPEVDVMLLDSGTRLR